MNGPACVSFFVVWKMTYRTPVVDSADLSVFLSAGRCGVVARHAQLRRVRHRALVHVPLRQEQLRRLGGNVFFQFGDSNTLTLVFESCKNGSGGRNGSTSAAVRSLLNTASIFLLTYSRVCVQQKSILLEGPSTLFFCL